MPGEGGEVVDLGKRRVEKNIAKRQLQQNAEIDERVGDEIKENVVPLKKPRQPACERRNQRPLDAREPVREQHPDESVGQKH